ncbi:translation initiation factor IF-3 [Candidatus Amarolinea dominans]|uniref:translation initiation factor IF-3 n=1 Tax=Candidatus Amarolinea dominans TaxID=3140696 RepID=UPI0031CC409A
MELHISEEGAISSKLQLRVNEMIRTREVRVVDDEGKQLGVLQVRDALILARQKGLDLVEVAPNSIPPVCRLMDFGKYQYERAKKERDARKSQKQIEVKELRLRPKTGEHDVAFKIRDARRFISEGNKVKIRIRFRGREITHPEVAREMLDRVAQELGDIAAIEQAPSMEGTSLLMILMPRES